MTGPSMQVRGQKLTKSVTKPDRSEGDVGQWASDQDVCESAGHESRVKNDKIPKWSA